MNETMDLFAWDVGNPLLVKLPEEKSFLEWGASLRYDPREKWRRSRQVPRESHFHTIEEVNIPTERSIRFSLSAYSMLLVSLRRRDPRLPQNRRRIYELAELNRERLGKELESMVWFSDGATGLILQGPTGCSKSHSLDAFLRLLPQVVEHGPNPDCGWMALKQLVYLKIPMPPDASRSTLLYTMVKEIDRLLETSYAADVAKRKTVGEKIVDVLQILMVHRCGMLILEEVQVRNVAPVVLGSDFVALFLRILNCGIPLVLVGNPIAFGHVLDFSQDLRRLTSAGMFNFGPVFDEEDPEWKSDLVPGIWSWTLLPKEDEYIPDLESLLYQRTGGAHDFLVKYRRESLIEAHRSGADSVSLAHMNAAFYSPSMIGLHKLIACYVNKDDALLSSISDQPVGYLADMWARERARRVATADQKRNQTP
ncbi:ATP-binding protein [Hydrogenophaga sp.]|uniref:ATP-binding protein n=1 Tax=Hydrogenophaga sp. TaxID=1904254 RepID=UPI002626EB75|nr:ATP-binding protein [Hydrogenophaga sp.]MDM7951446.1 ATP-binding protein [Hydrogenophaga sp.]